MVFSHCPPDKGVGGAITRNFPGIRPAATGKGRLQVGGPGLFRVLSPVAVVLAREMGVGTGGVVDMDTGVC